MGVIQVQTHLTGNRELRQQSGNDPVICDCAYCENVTLPLTHLMQNNFTASKIAARLGWIYQAHFLG